MAKLALLQKEYSNVEEINRNRTRTRQAGASVFTVQIRITTPSSPRSSPQLTQPPFANDVTFLHYSVLRQLLFILLSTVFPSMVINMASESNHFEIILKSSERKTFSWTCNSAGGKDVLYSFTLVEQTCRLGSVMTRDVIHWARGAAPPKFTIKGGSAASSGNSANFSARLPPPSHSGSPAAVVP